MAVAAGSVTRMRLTGVFRYGFAGLLLFALPLLTATAVHAQTKCGTADPKYPAELPRQQITVPTDGSQPGTKQPTLEVNGYCVVKAGDKTIDGRPQPYLPDYYYDNVNVTSGGTLIFQEGGDDTHKVTNFWARSIIVQNGGKIMAGVDDATVSPGTKPYGTAGYTLNIILYGNDQSSINRDRQQFPNGDPINNPGEGTPCKPVDCGAPTANSSGAFDKDWAPPTLDNGVKDYFYAYGPVYGTKSGYFGYKTLAVSYGGSLQLYGKKGTTGAAAADSDKTNSGTSWARLAGAGKDKKDVDLKPGDKVLLVDRNVVGDWQTGDKIVVTTTDYLPSHSEELEITNVEANGATSVITVKNGVQWGHVGKRYQPANKLPDRLSGMDPNLKQGAETRAAVALLTRSIRIVSGGDFANDYFDCASDDNWKTLHAPKELLHDKSDDIIKDLTWKDATQTEQTTKRCATARNNKQYSFGAHTQFRQGFRKLQLQGVEFHQMGVGGRKGHYPVHFHMARQVPDNTYVKDSSVSESMTRWFVLHSTQGVLLQRNVGWKSIGHGYYLEDGTEAENKFYANIGIYARAGVQGKENPRNIPGILAENSHNDAFTYRSDVVYPTVFWITNGWNEYVGNMAAGAGTCGVCFWYLSARNSDMADVPPDGKHSHMKWSGYAGRQAGLAGQTPVKLFHKNYCTTAMHSLNTTSAGISTCDGVRFSDEGEDQRIAPVKSIAPARTADLNTDHYYPHLGNNRNPTVCDPSKTPGQQDACSGPYDPNLRQNINTEANKAAKECTNPDPANCAVTIIDHYTSSFNWAQTNFSAIWLRTPGWFLVDNSFISDVQNGGLTFITGGDYSRSSTPLGYWGVVSNSMFVGQTQTTAGDRSQTKLPDNPYAAASGPHIDAKTLPCDSSRGDTCISKDDGVAYPRTAWATGQRLFNIYDGPAHQESNAYLDIKVSPCDNVNNPCLYWGQPGVAGMPGVRRYVPGGSAGYLPNAAIGWKQPNGFYYPPAFHSQNLYFDNVDIRHYVILPIFQPGSYLTDDAKLTDMFVGGVEGQVGKMTGFTDIDRQTVLNDDDGSLTGFAGSISVNEDGFFAAPSQTAQCRSNVTVGPDNACNTGSVKPSTTRQPPTARTSPYEYVTTVIYPGCAMADAPAQQPGPCGSMPDAENGGKRTRFDDKPGDRFSTEYMRGGKWSQDCAGPFCYGVPIYRQLLTGKKGTDSASSDREWKTWYDAHCGNPDKPQDTDKPIDSKGKVKPGCNFPFARMNGASEWQRDVMTVNGGKFYIDTTVKLETQQQSDRLGRPNFPLPGSNPPVQADKYVECSLRKDIAGDCWPRSVNLFEENQTYYTFFLFAKKSTKQVYQIYVGDNFDLKNGFQGIKITDTNGRFKYVKWDNSTADSSTTTCDKSAKPLCGELISAITGKPQQDKKGEILQVTVDFSKLTDTSLDPTDSKNKDETCKPANFCSWKTGSTTNSCGCSTSFRTDARAKINPKLWNTDGKTDTNGNPIGQSNGTCETMCSRWAVKSLDCPAGGCLGFSFKLPPGFQANDQYKRPPPQAFDETQVPWNNVSLKKRVISDQSLAGNCTYNANNQVPDTANAQCKVPDCGMGEANPPFCADKLPTANAR